MPERILDESRYRCPRSARREWFVSGDLKVQRNAGLNVGPDLVKLF